MTSMTRTTVGVTGGVDTHGQSHHAAVIDHLGRQLGDREFPASPAGYRALVEWLQGHGVVDRVGVEGTGTYVPAWLDISVRQGCSSSRSTARIDGPGGPTASRIRWTPIRLLGLRCLVLPRSCRSYATAASRRSGRFG
jgi:Transposase